MSESTTSISSKTDWERLDAMTDEDIDFSDCPEATADMFASAVVRHGISAKQKKAQVTLHLDQEVIEWFQKKEIRYQSKINGLLRAYMEAHS